MYTPPTGFHTEFGLKNGNLRLDLDAAGMKGNFRVNVNKH